MDQHLIEGAELISFEGDKWTDEFEKDGAPNPKVWARYW